LSYATRWRCRRDAVQRGKTTRAIGAKASPITVIIGNPPYNVGQQNENDNNKNRPYDVVDRRIRETYAKDSKATNRKALSDAYVSFSAGRATGCAGRTASSAS
jgi:predicted helicase